MKEKVNQIKGQYTEAAMAGGVSQSLGSQMNPFMSIRELTVSGLLAGITIFLGLTGYGFIPLIFMNATIYIFLRLSDLSWRVPVWELSSDSSSGHFLLFRRSVHQAF